MGNKVWWRSKKKEDELIKKFEDREKFKKEEIKEISSNDDTH